jgi:hypothetical protein
MANPARGAIHLAVLLTCACAAVAQEPVSPEGHLGRPVGRDFELADWDEVSSFYRQLAAHPRVNVEAVGTTTERREFLVAVVSSEENLARLDEIKGHARLLADPRGASDEQKRQALERGRPILMVSLGMHSTETSPPQFGLELAWKLATSDAEPWRTAREELVIVILPCTNPDGLDHVVSWYRETVGTPYEATGLTKLYQLYAGHDNNRDWFMLSLDETRIVTKLLYSEWFPTVYWDVHQQGRSGERMFVPPFRDPLNPNLDPAVMAGIGSIGARALLDMTREGYSGVSTGVSYDMWWNGGNRNVPVRHNIIGLLTEAASVQLATPVFLRRTDLRGPRGLGEYAPSNHFPSPWPGGWWRIRDIIDYELAFARSLVRTLSLEPRTWLASALAVSEHKIEQGRAGTPRAWILPSDNRDPGAVRRLVDTLLLSGIELHTASAAFEADGRAYPAGSLVIRREQPYGSHVKDLFEVQRYPEGDPPYDVAGWTLPYLMGVHRVEVVGEIDAELARATQVDAALAGFAGDGDAGRLAGVESDTWPSVFGQLAGGAELTWFTDGDDRGAFRAGGAGEAEGAQTLGALPRVGLYSPWSGSMDEGWLRWVFDRFELPYVRVRNEMLRAGRLSEMLDVLVLPDVSGYTLDRGRPYGSVTDEFSGGLDPEGAIAVEEFVREGGRLIAMEGSARWAVELFDLPLEDVTRNGGDFSCPGSVLRAIPEEAAVTAGLPASVAVFFSRGAAWQTTEEGDDSELEVLLRYAPTRVLLSGWARSPEIIAGQAAWVRAAHGDGQVHLFAFSPHFRAWCQGTFPLVFRAALLDD